MARGPEHGNFGQRRAETARNGATIVALFRAGKTLEEIAAGYGVSHQWIQQIIKRDFGLTKKDGGARMRGAIRRAVQGAANDARSLGRWGCTFEQYLTLKNMKKPTRLFAQQRKHAIARGIPFELKLWEWWTIWQESGKWAQRGRGQGYCMCREGDEGPYAVGNVFIAPCRVNSSETKQKVSDLPIGVFRRQCGHSYGAHRMIDGVKLYLGTHPTPELAHAAYLAAGVKR